jgi:hypothetical protein
VGTVGEKVARGVRTVRVDRRSVLGNPYVMGSEEEREAACDSYEALLTAGERVSAAAVRMIGEHHGFHGEVRGWDGAAAARELERLRRIHATHPMRLDCHCRGRRCHADHLAVLVAK